MTAVPREVGRRTPKRVRSSPTSARDAIADGTPLVESLATTLLSALRAKDPYTALHCKRVAELSTTIATELGLDAPELKSIYWAALLHDVGKIGLADGVLRKPGPLDRDEVNLVRQHPLIGAEIVSDADCLSFTIPVILHHHERWDGTGYPHGLSGTDIPVAARVCAVADTVDSLLYDRPYRTGMDHDQVKQVLCTGAGKQWDRNMVEAYLRVVNADVTGQPFVRHDHRSSFMEKRGPNEKRRDSGAMQN